ncbi:MAG TPA: hypothetical protein IGS52_21970 [Oscillatoriaceae cyanobacterium M33_DOE_052]|uniref:Uncharacterized protein n=1 Tax=Planktothricoides sp. SpSt-374 TaxID=2282167 RepID=A0A7C3ZIS1_9CYAN|nr:hypothetical protein [Oscillatoriaceae cyanobacterium M33_DOE_052]
MIFNWPFRDSSDGDKKITREDERRIVAQFKEWLPRILAVPEVQAMITFEQVINYLQSDHPPNSAANESVVIRQSHAKGQLLGLVFLDQNNQLICRPDGTPYGRQLLARQLDGKLQQNFGKSNFIFLKIEEKELSKYGLDLDVFEQFGELLRDLLKLTEVVPMMTYEDAIKYFVTDRPKDPRIRKGAILRKPHRQGHHVIQIFLDENNDPVCDSGGQPHGRQLVARELDYELQEYFGDKYLIIVE